MFPMDDPVTLGGPGDVVIMANPLTWELLVNEGPWIVKHDGVYYLIYSGNDYRLNGYALGYATADDPLGPFEKYPRNPFLKMDEDYDFWGPGHNSVVEGPDGHLWTFYHTKTSPEYAAGRRIRKNRIAFTDDGQLYVELGIGEPPPLDDDDDDDDDTTDDDDDNDTTDDDTLDDDDVVGDDDTLDGDDDVGDDDTLDDDDDAHNTNDDDDDGCGC